MAMHKALRQREWLITEANNSNNTNNTSTKREIEFVKLNKKEWEE